MTLSTLYLGNCRVGGYQGHEGLVASTAVVGELHWGGGGGGPWEKTMYQKGLVNPNTIPQNKPFDL